jgi:soluble P-type ATPase
MFEVSIPGFAVLRLKHLVLDYNGTLALDGELLPGVDERLRRLADSMTLHVVTADTFGTAGARLAHLPCELVVLPGDGQAQAKRSYVERLGASQAACIGNGRNDRLMLAAAALGIAVVQAEGASAEAVAAADVVAPDIRTALDLLLHPQRLVATLRE